MILRRRQKFPQSDISSGVTDVRENTEILFLQLAIAYATILFLGLLFPYFRFFIRWEVFALILVIVGTLAAAKKNIKADAKAKNLKILVLLAFLTALGLRAAPYLNNDIPIGYDAGLYKYMMEKYFTGLPNVPEESLDLWMKTGHEQGLFLLSDALHVFGINAIQMETFFFILLGALLVFPIYLVGKRFAGEKAAAMAALLYAISFTQFRAFEFLYYKTILGIFMLLMAVWLLETKRKFLAGLFMAGIAIFHRPELFLFGFVFLGCVVMNLKEKKKLKSLLIAATFAIALALPFYLPRLNETVFQALAATITQPGSGTFFDFGTYHCLSLAYIPFGFIGFAYFVMKRKFNPLFFLFLANFILVFFELVFFYRFIIPLDVSLVIFAGVGLLVLADCRGYPKLAIIFAIVLLFIAGLSATFLHSLSSAPQVGEGQIKAAEWLSSANGSYVIAESFDTPHVLGWSGKKVIAPGFLDWNLWSKSEWFEFMGGSDLNNTIKLLNRYNSTPYIYFSKLPETVCRKEKFNNSCFENVYETGDAVIYKYDGC